MKCLNCAHEFEGKFCPDCGQAAATGRLTMRNLVRPALELANLEHGLWPTIAGLMRAPGTVINGYLAGRRMQYVPPVRFVVIAVSSALLLLWVVGPNPASGQSATIQTEISRVMERWGSALLLLTVPLCALATRVVFYRQGLNLTEHLALNAYVFGLQNWVSLVLMPLQRVGPTMSAITSMVYVLFCIGYFAVALRQTLARSWWAAVLSAALITVLAWGVFYVVLAMAIARLRG